MTAPLIRPATPDGLFLWVMHRFSEAFEDHAIIKGGIALQLLDCPRSTTGIDYVFVPFRSKKEIQGRIEGILSENEDAKVEVRAHSRMLRATMRVDSASIQIEASVALDCPSTPVPTAALAIPRGQPSRIVRIMAPDCALAHKLAAWNERRLLRDLYDCYFLASRAGANPELELLDTRLTTVESRLPRVKKRRTMTRTELAVELRGSAAALTEDALREELGPILPPDELVGLVPRIRSAVVRIAEKLEASIQGPDRS